MKKTFYFLFLMAMIAVYTPAKAVLVNIPDANFRARLQTLYPACFVGTQMETTCSGITSAIELSVSSSNISNLSGIEYFTGLKILDCGFNQLRSLPILPASLLNLECGVNYLTSLPTLPTNLQVLRCPHNEIITLNNLPATLKILVCENNKLVILPALPTNLTVLDCGDNKLTSLPALPNSLKYLSCSQNQLISLPTLPNILIQLECSFNKLISLPIIPYGLEYLGCTYNQLDFTDFEIINPKPDAYFANNQTYAISPATQTVINGENISYDGTIGGSANQYQWYKNDIIISGATNAIYSKTNISIADAGVYQCKVTSNFVGAGTTRNITITSSNIYASVPCSVTITPDVLPDGYSNQKYMQSMFQTGLTGTPKWSISEGRLPSGLFIYAETGLISGVIQIGGDGNGVFDFVIQLTNGTCYQTKAYTITITAENPVINALDNALSNLVKVSPNPSNGDFNIDFGSIDMNKSLLRVYDTQGKTVFSSENNINLMTISLEKFASGIYLLEAQTGKTRIMKKLVKQ